MNIMILYIN